MLVELGQAKRLCLGSLQESGRGLAEPSQHLEPMPVQHHNLHAFTLASFFTSRNSTQGRKCCLSRFSFWSKKFVPLRAFESTLLV